MSSRQMRLFFLTSIFGLVILLVSCGGGGKSTSSTTKPVVPFVTITTTSLPNTLQGHSYQTTLAASGGQSPLHWSIDRSAGEFVDGLSIDPNTGVLSGTANFGGTAGFTATVSDSSSPAQMAVKSFTITAFGPLTGPAALTFNSTAFGGFSPDRVSIQEGFPPVVFLITAGSPPRGLRMDPTTGVFSGTPSTPGTFQFTVTAQDSFSPPEVITQQVTFNVLPATLTVPESLPSRIVLNQPFSGRIAVVGGTPPYSFATFGELPAGLGAIDTNTGMVSGMPTTANAYQFTVLVKDSSSPPQSASQAFVMTVMPPVRNDTPATATSIPGNITVAGSISPYIDPPNDAPLAADTDYYKLVSFPGATVHVETTAKRTNSSNPLDTVIEIVDGNGIRLNNCRQPGDTSSTFTSSCINDDISDNPHVQDSALDFQVPGSNNSPTTFYVHVFDFRGDARPDMTYLLQVSGAMMPLTVAPSTLRPAARGNPYGGNVISQNGTGAVTWSLAPGSNLPPGLTLDNNGFVHGTPSTDGTFSFAVQVTDSGSPAQTATGQETIQVVEPITITSPATLPDACVNQPYIFVAQRTGGVPPTGWGLNNLPFAGLLLNFSSGVLSGTPTVTGTFTGTLSTSDATQTNASQQITLTVKQCP